MKRDQPLALVLVGCICTGKTTFRRSLQQSAKLSLKCISPDDIRRAFVKEHNEVHSDTIVYQNTFPKDVAGHSDREVFNRICLDRAESLSRLWAETGYDVVHDDVNHTVARRRRLVEIFRSHSRRVIAVVFEAPKSVILERLISRDQVALEKGESH